MGWSSVSHPEISCMSQCFEGKLNVPCLWSQSHIYQRYSLERKKKFKTSKKSDYKIKKSWSIQLRYCGDEYITIVCPGRRGGSICLCWQKHIEGIEASRISWKAKYLQQSWKLLASGHNLCYHHFPQRNHATKKKKMKRMKFCSCFTSLKTAVGK